jgi:hypothetical protein
MADFRLRLRTILDGFLNLLQVSEDVRAEYTKADHEF